MQDDISNYKSDIKYQATGTVSEGGIKCRPLSDTNEKVASSPPPP